MDEATFRKVLKESLAEQTVSFDDKLNIGLAKQFGYFARRLDTLGQKLDSKANGERVYTALEGIARRLETDEQERAATSVQLARHVDWFSQLANTTHTKLVPEQ